MRKFILTVATLAVFWMHMPAGAQPPGRGTGEEKRRDQVWSLFQGREASDIHCNGIAECNGLIDTFLKRSGMDFVTPLLRAASPHDGRLRSLLGPCFAKDFDNFTISDSIKYVHMDKAFGPVALYAFQQDGAPALWRAEFEDLRREAFPKGKREPLHGIKLIDRATCAVKDESSFNQDGLIDAGFVRYQNQNYHYLIGQPPGMTYYFIILEPGGPDLMRSATGLYLEMR